MSSKNLSIEKNLIPADSDLQAAVKCFNVAKVKIGLIVGDDGSLIATLTDGDVRRCLANGASLSEKALKYANKNPKTITKSCSLRPSEKHDLQIKGVFSLPVVDETKKLCGLLDLTEKIEKRKETVVIMAGGLGSRLGEMTKHTPKPMLKILNKPIIQHVIESFVTQGFENFVISLRHESEQFVGYFGNGDSLSINISYIIEKTPLGTAGALSLQEFSGPNPIIVTNADVVTNFNFSEMIFDHHASQNMVTIIARDYEIAVPYGVINRGADGKISIEEKPLVKLNVSSGINLFSPEILSEIKKNQYLDMPTLIQNVVNSGHKVGYHQASGYWIDVGVKAELDRFQSDMEESVLW